MKDTSEFPDATEQATTTGARTRHPARPKQDSTTTPSQDQDGKSSAPRRRTPSSTSGTPVSPSASGTERPPHTPTPTNRPAPPQQGTMNGMNGPRQGQGGSSMQRPNTQSQRSGVAPNQGPRVANNNAQAPSAPGARSASTQRPIGNSGNASVQRPAGNGGNFPNQRPAGNGGNFPNQRPAGNAPSPRPYSNTGNVPTQRQGNAPYSQRPTPSGFAPTQHGNTTTAQRPSQGSRPSGQSHSRSGGQGYQGQGRPTSRTGAPTQRPVERRVAAVKEKPTGPISIPPQILVKDLADLLQATPNEIIKGLINNGIFANINQIVEYDKAALVAKEMGFEPSQSAVTAGPAIQSENKLSANEEMMAQRDNDNNVVIPPVVTIMGHVDHGKTSLLDTIRKTKVAAGEAGGITQHIGAYQVEINGKKITFLDTPGHEAFTAMRARGAQVTHIAVIVVAADDGVMPQTREAISHAQAAKVPIIIALNKIDKDNANPEYVKQQLAEMGVVIEEYGGDVGCIPVSARKGIGIDDLLEYILLLTEVQDIRANPNRLATGVIIEARLEKNSGPMATVLVQQGTLKMGDNIVVGALAGKVRAMFNDRGKRIQKAPPSTPVSIIGLSEVPQAGDRLEVAPDERTAKQRALAESEKRRDESGTLGQVSLDTLYMQMQQGKVKELNIVLKCDVQGSSEAIKNALTKVGEDNLKVRLIHEGIGNISETDVHLAAASGAIVIGFNVKADGAAQREAQKENVDIRYYNVIYKLTDDIQAALTGMLEPTYHEVVEGHAEVIQTFKAGKNLVIAGCRVTDGKITRSSQARVMRKNEKVHEGKIGSLRRGKDDVREIATGYECGIVLEEFNEFEVGDIIEAFNQERVK